MVSEFKNQRLFSMFCVNDAECVHYISEMLQAALCAVWTCTHRGKWWRPDNEPAGTGKLRRISAYGVLKHYSPCTYSVWENSRLESRLSLFHSW
jgi:hypothetical protein